MAVTNDVHVVRKESRKVEYTGKHADFFGLKRREGEDEALIDLQGTEMDAYAGRCVTRTELQEMREVIDACLREWPE